LEVQKTDFFRKKQKNQKKSFFEKKRKKTQKKVIFRFGKHGELREHRPPKNKARPGTHQIIQYLRCALFWQKGKKSVIFFKSRFFEKNEKNEKSEFSEKKSGEEEFFAMSINFFV
jgi:hypothetical protein